MKYTFHCTGHDNILATHVNTIEFTKDCELSLRGNCIVGINSDYDHKKIMEITTSYKKAKAKMECSGITDGFEFECNRGFSDDKELVFRISNFCSSRTAGIFCTKGAMGIKRELVKLLKDPKSKLKVTLFT